MRELRLIHEGSPCDVSFYPDGPKTVAEALERGRSFCPFRARCQTEHNPAVGFQCVMRFGVDMARYTLKLGTTVEQELEDFRGERPTPVRGWLYSPDRVRFELVTDLRQVEALVGGFARSVLDTTTPPPLPQAAV